MCSAPATTFRRSSTCEAWACLTMLWSASWATQQVGFALERDGWFGTEIDGHSKLVARGQSIGLFLQGGDEPFLFERLRAQRKIRARISVMAASANCST